MVVEFLFLDFEEVEKVKQEVFTIKESSAKGHRGKNTVIVPEVTDYGGKVWRVTLSHHGANENTAQELSAICEQMMRHNPIVTQDDVSAFYNRKLYPLVNEFERNLRRLLYVNVALNDGKKMDAITQLERLDFGKIHDMLFVDSEAEKQIKSLVNNKPHFTIKEIMDDIGRVKENSLWNTNVKDDELRIIKDDFLLLKEYRNDVMHAHRIDAKRYHSIRIKFEEVNKLLVKKTENRLSVDKTVFIDIDSLSKALEKAYESTLGQSLEETFLTYLKQKLFTLNQDERRDLLNSMIETM